MDGGIEEMNKRERTIKKRRPNGRNMGKKQSKEVYKIAQRIE